MSFPTRDFTRFWAGETVSSFGSYITTLALQTLVVLTLDGTAQDVGWLNSARWLPYLVLGLVVGALVDRVRRRPVMVTTDLLRAALLVSIPVAHALDVLSLPLLLVVVACFGAMSLVNDAASMSFITRLVPREHLQRAHSRIDGADAVAQTAGPATAGLLVKLVGAPLAVLVDAATYLFSAVVVLSLRVTEPEPSPSPTPSVWREIREGVGWVYRGTALTVLAISTHVWFAANAVLGAVLAPYALITLGLSPLQFGLAAACLGVGGFLGAATSGAGGRRLGTGGAVIFAHAVTTVGVLVIAAAGLGTSGWLAAAVLGLGQLGHGFAIGFSNSHEMSFQQAQTPDAFQARMNITKRSFNRAMIVVFAPLGGLLAVQAGNRVGPAGLRGGVRAWWCWRCWSRRSGARRRRSLTLLARLGLPSTVRRSTTAPLFDRTVRRNAVQSAARGPSAAARAICTGKSTPRVEMAVQTRRHPPSAAAVHDCTAYSTGRYDEKRCSPDGARTTRRPAAERRPQAQPRSTMAATGPPPSGPWWAAETDTKTAGSPVTAAVTPPTQALIWRCQCTSESSSIALRRPRTSPSWEASHLRKTLTSLPSRSLVRGRSGRSRPASLMAFQMPSWSRASFITEWPIR